MKTIEFGSKAYRVAENWAELTTEQYVQLILCPRLKADGSFDTVEHQAAACRVWLGMSPRVWRDLIITPWQWGQLRQQFAWLFNTAPEGKPPLMSFECGGVNYHLPAADMADTTGADLAAANMAYLEFAAPPEDGVTDVDSKTKALNQLVAILCRPRRKDWRKFMNSDEWNGDVREPFNEARAQAHAEQLDKLPLNLKMLVLDYFERSNNAFLALYGELFGKSREPRYQDGRGWVMLLKNVAKDGHFGDYEKVCTMPAHLLFASLLDDLLNQQEAQEREKAQHP
ncbi:hypothetical protein FAES_2308 [Fibrella aestuarina BUZ 2]|uniref:Uncharacterized protein n=1 Tax=Fibrella aestuarina BUZ 2 TaxID=1166018 RepID=I0K864_9BACT|nr:hypothetical protein [Fibrella aestuarina]CCH00317.1 hypothetical protein FAES_2308 [Fibrella aestuarina BUZ 2]